MAPVMYGDNTHWQPIQRNAGSVWENDSNVPAVESENGNADVISGCFRADGHDLIVTDVDGNKIPSEIAYFSKGEVKLQLYYRDPAQDTVSGGTELYLQWGGATVNEANDPNVWHDDFGGSMDHKSVLHLEEAAGDAIDSSGTQDGTVLGCVREQAGKIGKAYSFDGSDYIDITGVTTGNNFTVMFLAKTTDTVCYFMDCETGRYIIAVLHTTDKFAVFDGDWRDSGVDVSDDTWYLLTAVKNDTGNNILYKDNVEVLNEAGSVVLLSDSIKIGSRFNGDPDWYTGLIDEFRIIDDALSENQKEGQYDNLNGYATNASITLGTIEEFVAEVPTPTPTPTTTPKPSIAKPKISTISCGLGL